MISADYLKYSRVIVRHLMVTAHALCKRSLESTSGSLKKWNYDGHCVLQACMMWPPATYILAAEVLNTTIITGSNGSYI